MASMSRVRAEPGSERRDQILAIAGRLIAARGYSATTVRDIADEAGILSGSLYHHFASKEAILEEILRGFMDELINRFEEIAAREESPRAALDALVAFSFQTIEKHPDAVALYQNEQAYLSVQPGFEFVAEQSARIEEIWREQLRRGQSSGDLRASLDTAIVYRFLRDSVWSTVRWFRPGGRHTAASLTEHFLDLLHHGILAD